MCFKNFRRMARASLIVAMSLLLPAHDLFARGGGGGGARGGGGGARVGEGGGARGGGGGARGGEGMGARGGGGGNRGGGAGVGNRGGGGGGAGNRGGEGGVGNRSGIGEAGKRGSAGGAGIGNQSGQGARNSSGIGNRSNNTGLNNIQGGNVNRGNINSGNVNRGNINAGNTVNVNRNNINNVNGRYGNNYWHNGYNNYWHNGYWPGYRPYGYGWGAAATAGLVGWGLGSMAASSGYGGGYSNPYYVSTPATSGTSADYSAPLQNPPASQTASTEQKTESAPPPAQVDGLKAFDAAREAFRSKQYDEALTKVDQAVKQLPGDPALHEFRGLVLFALARYPESASAIYAVLSAGPGWNWTTLSSMYASIDDYTNQLRALEAFERQHPDSPDGAFLLGYHYLTGGYNDQAAKQFQIVTKLLPEDRLAPQLLRMTSPDAAAPQPAPGEAPASDGQAPADDAPPIDKGKLLGTWKASPAKGVAIELSLKSDGSFAWKVTQGGKPNVLEGQNAVEESRLSLQQKGTGETMIGRVLFADNGGFNFKLVETGPGDPGLNFSK